MQYQIEEYNTASTLAIAPSEHWENIFSFLRNLNADLQATNANVRSPEQGLKEAFEGQPVDGLALGSAPTH